MAKKDDIVSQHIAALKAMKGASVEAGWFESSRYQSKKPGGGAGIAVARIARIQEFGATIKRNGYTIVIPPRPFMRLAHSRIMQKKTDMQKKIAKMLIRGQIKPEQAMAQIGLFMEGEIVLSIRNGGWQPNAPSTVAKKGFDKPLIDTAQMWQSVASKVSEPT